MLADIQGANKPAELNGWQQAVADYGDTELYAIEVYETLKEGASSTISTGESLELPPQKGVEVPQLVTTASGRADYRKARWRPASPRNYTNAHRGAAKIDMIVIHVAQGGFSATINWFQNPIARASAHYVVGRKGAVAQCVHNADIAWHAGWWKTNKKSIGIEHAGYAGARWPAKMYRSSARLSARLCKRFNIPVYRHIIRHRSVPGVATNCPGRGYNRYRYLRLVRRYM